jgi:hypothetical protein
MSRQSVPSYSSDAGDEYDSDCDISDIFTSSMLTAYPYREPRVDPKLYQSQVPNLIPLTNANQLTPENYKPRAGGNDYDSQVWDCNKLSYRETEDYLNFARSIAPHLSEEWILTLLRDCNYSLIKAKFVLIQPLQHQNLTSKFSSLQTQSNAIHSTTLHHNNIHTRQMKSGLHWTSLNLPAQFPVTTDRAVTDFTVRRHQQQLGRINSMKINLKNAVEIASAAVNFKPKSSATVSSGGTKRGAPSGSISPHETKEDDEDLSNSGPDTGEIDVVRLRDLIQAILDPSDSNVAASQTLSSEIINTLQVALAQKNSWLEMVRPLINNLTKSREGIVLSQVQQLLVDSETICPGITSKEKKKLFSTVQKAEEWNNKARSVFHSAMGYPIDANHVEAEKIIPHNTHKQSNSLSLTDFKLLIRDCDKQCGGIHTEESIYMRLALHFAKNFQQIVQEKVKKSLGGGANSEEEQSGSDSEGERKEKRSTRNQTAYEQLSSTEIPADPAKSALPTVSLPPAKLSLQEAQHLLVDLRRKAPFLYLSEAEFLAAEVAKTQSWLTEAQNVLRISEDQQCYSAGQQLLKLAENYTLAINETATLQRALLARQWFTQFFAELRALNRQANERNLLSTKNLSLERLKEYLTEAEKIPIPLSNQRFASIYQLLRSAEEVQEKANNALNNTKAKRLTLEQWQALLEEMNSLPLILADEQKVDRVVKNTNEWLQQAAELVKEIQSNQFHAVDFDRLESCVNRIAGRSIALLTVENNPHLEILKKTLRMGRIFNEEVVNALKLIKSINSAVGGRDRARAERAAAVQNLKLLHSLYSSSPSTIDPHQGTQEASFLARYKVELSEFSLGINNLQLKLIERAENRLKEIEEFVAEAVVIQAGEKLVNLEELHDIAQELRKIGQSDDVEPLLTLCKRYEIACSWRNEALRLLPIRYGGEESVVIIKKKGYKKRRTDPRRKKAAAIARANKKGAKPEIAESSANSDQLDDTLLNEEGFTANPAALLDLDEEEAEEESESDEESEAVATKSRPAAQLHQLITLLEKYEKHTAAATENSNNARIDLVAMEEVEKLRSCLKDCSEWQTEARAALKADPELPVEAMKDILQRGKSLGVSIPEIQEIGNQSWSRLWVDQVRTLLSSAEPSELSVLIGLLNELSYRYPQYQPAERKFEELNQSELEFEDENNQQEEEDAELNDLDDESGNEDKTAGVEAAKPARKLKQQPRANKKEVKAESAAALATGTTDTLGSERKAAELSGVTTPSGVIKSEGSAAMEEGEDSAMHADEDEEDISTSFLFIYRVEIGGLETRVHSMLSWEHKTRQLFERRLGARATDAILGPQLKTVYAAVISGHDTRRDIRPPDSLTQDNEMIDEGNITINESSTSRRQSARKVADTERKAIIELNSHTLLVDSSTVGGESDSEADEAEQNKLYCYCQRHYGEGELMINCDLCQQWFHCNCLYLTKSDVKKLTSNPFICPDCCISSGKLYRFRDKLPTRKSRVRGPKLQSLTASLHRVPSNVVSQQLKAIQSLVQRAEEWLRYISMHINQLALPPNSEQWRIEKLRAAEYFQQEKLRLAEREKEIKAKPIDTWTKTGRHANANITNNNNINNNNNNNNAASFIGSTTYPATGNGEEGEESDGAEEALAQQILMEEGGETQEIPFVAFQLAIEPDGRVQLNLDVQSHLIMVNSAANMPDDAAGERNQARRRLKAVSPHLLPANHADFLFEQDWELLYQEKLRREQATKVAQSHVDALSTLLRSALSLPVELGERRIVEDRIRLLLCMERAEKVLILNQCTRPSTVQPERKRHDVKELYQLLVEMQRSNPVAYVEANSLDRNLIFDRFSFFYSRVNHWHERCISKLNMVNTLHDLLQLQIEMRLYFPNLLTSTVLELNKRISLIIKWIPREKKALRKKQTHSELIKLLNERFNDIKGTYTPYTKKIEYEINRADEWTNRLTKVIEEKCEPATFQLLLNEIHEKRLLIDEKDIETAAGFIQLYCLCYSVYQDGVFMIGCDGGCEGWYHPECVGLESQKKAEKIKKYKCPRCCRRDGSKYAYGNIPGFHDKTDEELKQIELQARQKQIAVTTGHNFAPGNPLNPDLTAYYKGFQAEGMYYGSNPLLNPLFALSSSSKNKTKRDRRKSDSKRAKKEEESDSSSAEESDADRKRRKTEKKRVRTESTGAAAAAVPASNPNALPPSACALYATLLYDHLHDKVTAENSNVLWHLLNSYMAREFDSRLQEEMIEAVKLVCGEQILAQALIPVNRIFLDKLKDIGYFNSADAQARHQKAKRGAEEATHSAVISSSSSKRQRAKKPKGYPRAPLTGYKYFMKHIRSAKQEFAAVSAYIQSLGQEVNDKSVTRVIAEKWKALNDDQKQIFEQLSAQDKLRYEAEVAQWNQTHSPLKSGRKRKESTDRGNNARDDDEESESDSGGDLPVVPHKSKPLVSSRGPSPNAANRILMANASNPLALQQQQQLMAQMGVPANIPVQYLTPETLQQFQLQQHQLQAMIAAGMPVQLGLYQAVQAQQQMPPQPQQQFSASANVSPDIDAKAAENSADSEMKRVKSAEPILTSTDAHAGLNAAYAGMYLPSAAVNNTAAFYLPQNMMNLNMGLTPQQLAALQQQAQLMRQAATSGNVFRANAYPFAIDANQRLQAQHMTQPIQAQLVDTTNPNNNTGNNANNDNGSAPMNDQAPLDTKS